MSEPPPRSLSAHSVIDVVMMSLETFEPDLNCVEKLCGKIHIINDYYNIYVLIFVRNCVRHFAGYLSRDTHRQYGRWNRAIEVYDILLE